MTHVEIELVGSYADFVHGESQAKHVSERHVVEKALALLAILSDGLDGGQQVVVQHFFESTPDPLLRVDYYLPPAVSVDLSHKPAVAPDQRTHSELMTWPPATPDASSGGM